jgi:large subunit ribosomal protein LP2
MKHLAAYLLLGLAGNTSPSASDIKGVLESVGIDAEEDRLEKLLSELEGKDIATVRRQQYLEQLPIVTDSLLQLIQEGSSKLASVPSGGAGGGAAAGGAPAAGAAAAAVEEKPAEKEEEKEESDEDMGFGLFD